MWTTLAGGVAKRRRHRRVQPAVSIGGDAGETDGGGERDDKGTVLSVHLVRAHGQKPPIMIHNKTAILLHVSNVPLASNIVSTPCLYRVYMCLPRVCMRVHMYLGLSCFSIGRIGRSE